MSFRNNYRKSVRPQRTRRFAGRAPKTFDPREMIETMNSVEENSISEETVFVSKNIFSDFNLNPSLQSNIVDRNYTSPTPIQDQVIPEILNLKNVVGIANTGTGKTAAFLIPLIERVLSDRTLRVLIVAPTRELAIQINEELRSFAHNLSVFSSICIGGVSMNSQLSQLRRDPQFVIGTPGRLLDLSNQRALNFGKFSAVVLDEVDRMLDMGFIRDVTSIISLLPEKRQSLFFSATLDEDIKRVMARFITNPVIVSVKSRETSKNVMQEVVILKGRNKADVLIQILDEKEVEKALVFMRTKRSADMMHRNLSSIGFNTSVLHGNKSQNQRQHSLEQFRQGRVNILIATDVAARGIDIDDITHVINYDLPESYEAYIHRIGRTGRADKKGKALTFVV